MPETVYGICVFVEQLLAVEDDICKVVEDISTDGEASVAAVKVSSVLQAEQHLRALTKVTLKQVS